MFQSHHLFKLLPAAIIFFCVHAGGFNIVRFKENPPQARPTNPARARLSAIYNREIGVRELKNNEGKRVEEYLRFVGLPKGQPWCAAFVCWALGKAELENPRSGWSPQLFPSNKVIWERSRQLHVDLPGQRAKKKPRQADVFGIYFTDKGRIAHCGFIDKWSQTWVITVEGNTNLAGSREGDGVYRKRRLRSSLYKVADWVGDG